jgi:hypothetical protein
VEKGRKIAFAKEIFTALTWNSPGEEEEQTSLWLGKLEGVKDYPTFISNKRVNMLRKIADLGRQLVMIARAKQLEVSGTLKLASSEVQEGREATQHLSDDPESQMWMDGNSTLAGSETEIDRDLQVTEADREATPAVHAPVVLTLYRSGNGTVRAAGSAHLAFSPKRLTDIVGTVHTGL